MSSCICNSGWPRFFTIPTSSIPGMVFNTWLTCWDIIEMLSRLSPKIFTAWFTLIPAIASFTLSIIGWEKAQIVPTCFSSSFFCIWPISSSFVRFVFHCSLGYKSTKFSMLKKPLGSEPSSGRPTWETTSFTSGNSSKSFLILSASTLASFNEILIGASPSTHNAPSFRWGINSVPKNFAEANVIITTIAAIDKLSFLLRITQLKIFS